MNWPIEPIEVARQLFAEHGPAGRRLAYERARECKSSGREEEAATWLEVVRLVAGISSLPSHNLASETVLTSETVLAFSRTRLRTQLGLP
jgi:hypothetical protein